MLHGKEEGIVTRIKSGKLLEVDLGDGFSIEVLTSEVVLISPMEARLENRAGADSAAKAATSRSGAIGSKPFSTRGIYFAFVPINDREIVLHLINLSDWRLLFTIFGRTDGRNKGMASGVLEGGKSAQITKLLLKDFEAWPVFETRLLLFSEEQTPEEPARQHALKCRIQRFHKSLQKAPLLHVNAHVFQLDENPEKTDAPAFSAESIRDSLLGKPSESTNPDTFKKRTPAQIDLHVGSLGEATRQMSNSEILALQLATFKKYLESAIAGGLEEVTIIHGVGQGTLKHEIHRQLSKHPNVAFFKEAQKEKFGYGATIAHLK